MLTVLGGSLDGRASLGEQGSAQSISLPTTCFPGGRLVTLALVSPSEQRAVWLLWLRPAGQLLQRLRNPPWEPGGT